MFSAGIRDFRLLFPDITINVDTNQRAVFENNPYIDTTLKDGNGVEHYRVGYPMIGSVNNSAMHFSTMFLFDMIAAADLHQSLPLSIGEFCAIFANGTVGDPPLGDLDKHKDVAKEPFIALREKYKNFCEKFVRQRGDLHLTDIEKKNNIIKEIYHIDKYWVIAPGGKRDCTAKIWDWRKFQSVIDHFDGKIKFVTIGMSDLLIEKLNNVIDLTDKFNKDLRGLFSLVYNADGCVCGPSALMHIAAAIPSRWDKERKPCVTILGGREPSAWTWYCNHQVLHTNGAFECCDNGGCWKARVIPLPKDPQHNGSLCDKTVVNMGRTIQACMDSITASDVIRAISKYYDGNIYTYLKNDIKQKKENKSSIIELKPRKARKTINLLGNLNTAGGGEQSLVTIVKLLLKRDWKVNLYPWGSVHENYLDQSLPIMQHSYQNGMLDNMQSNIPLLFYGNDCIWDFVKTGQQIVDKSSEVIIGINYCNGSLPKCDWLARNDKLKAIIFQNTEKKNEFERDAIGFENISKIVLYGAIELDKFLEVCTKAPVNNELVILKTCVADYRKYVTKDSCGSGDKIHLWQKNLDKELDTKFYERLLKDTKNTRFEFMEAHKELVDYFKNESRMVFHKWDSMSVTDFLSRGHLYLYRTSNMWRDQLPRGMIEAMAAGLPILGEARDGPFDRIRHGDNGMLCLDYDSYLYAIKLLQRKEDYRCKMGQFAKDWARQHYNPERWVDIIEEILE